MMRFPPRQINREKRSHGGLLWLLTFVPCICMLLQPGLSAHAAVLGVDALNPDMRARAIVKQMTLDEKILELHGVGGSSPNIRIVPAISRLGIPAFVITNGPD